MVATNDPNRTIWFQKATCGLKPCSREFIISTKAAELVPVIINRIHFGIIGTMQVTFELQIIGRICKDQINRFSGQTVHHIDAIASNNFVQWKRHSRLHRCHRTLNFGHIFLPLLGSLLSSFVVSNLSQRRFEVNFFIESIGYYFLLIQHIVYRFERTSMVWGYSQTP